MKRAAQVTRQRHAWSAAVLPRHFLVGLGAATDMCTSGGNGILLSGPFSLTRLYRSVPNCSTTGLVPKKKREASVPSAYCLGGCLTPRSARLFRRSYGSASNTTTTTTTTTTTIDEEEVARLSESGRLKWWDPEGEMKPLHRMNPKRVAYLRTCLTRRLKLDPFAPRPFTGISFLDLGCGPGLLTESLARLGGEVLGVDASEANINTAIKHAGNDSALSSLSYRVGTAEALAAEGKQFDVVCSLEVIEHVNNPELFLDSLCSMIKPGGSLFLSTINRTIKSYALAIIGAEYILGWVPPGTHQWNKFVQPTELAVLLHRAKMNVEEMAGLEYQPLSGSWSFTSDTSVNYMLWATKPAMS